MQRGRRGHCTTAPVAADHEPPTSSAAAGPIARLMPSCRTRFPRPSPPPTDPNEARLPVTPPGPCPGSPPRPAVAPGARLGSDDGASPQSHGEISSSAHGVNPRPDSAPRPGTAAGPQSCCSLRLRCRTKLKRRTYRRRPRRTALCCSRRPETKRGDRHPPLTGHIARPRPHLDASAARCVHGLPSPLSPGAGHPAFPDFSHRNVLDSADFLTVIRKRDERFFAIT